MVIVESMPAVRRSWRRRWVRPPELIDEGVNGYLRDDIEALAAAVDMAASLDRTRIRKVAVDRFTASRMADEHVDLYRRAIAAHRAGLAA